MSQNFLESILDAEIPILKEFAAEYLKYQKDVIKKRSWRRDEYALKHFLELFKDKRLSNIMPKDIDDYKQLRLADVTPSTVNKELVCIRRLFNLAKLWKKHFSENPVSQARLLSVNDLKERIFTLNEEVKLLNLSNQFLKPIIITALNTGMRKSEILTLKWTNVEFENNLITLEHTNTKSKEIRRIPINSIMRKLLLEQKLKSGGSEYVFLSESGMPYKRHDSLNGAFERLCKKALKWMESWNTSGRKWRNITS
ncbi:MAG: tyrosine-type recombinase/integrase [Ignavibacteriales bacterium]